MAKIFMVKQSFREKKKKSDLKFKWIVYAKEDFMMFETFECAWEAYSGYISGGNEADIKFIKGSLNDSIQ